MRTIKLTVFFAITAILVSLTAFAQNPEEQSTRPTLLPVVETAQGRVKIYEKNNARVHTYLSNDADHATNIIESENQLVLFDAQFTRTYAEDFRAYADSLGKPIERVIISHAHPDHYLGLAMAFADLEEKIYALEETIQDATERSAGFLDYWKTQQFPVRLHHTFFCVGHENMVFDVKLLSSKMRKHLVTTVLFWCRQPKNVSCRRTSPRALILICCYHHVFIS